MERAVSCLFLIILSNAITIIVFLSVIIVADSGHTLRTRCRGYILPCLIASVIAAALVALVALVVAAGLTCYNPEEPIKADRGRVAYFHNDTVLYRKVDRHHHVNLEVTLIQTTATAYFYKQECKNLRTHTINDTFRSANYSVPDIFTGRVTVNLKNAYLLKGSFVNFSIHILSINASNNFMTFMVFDTANLYDMCINGKDKDCFPVYERPIDPTQNETSFLFEITSTDDYYMLFICHGEFEFYFTYFEHTLYYNHLDYNQACNFTVNDNSKHKVCTFEFNTDSGDECLLVYLSPTVINVNNLTTQWLLDGTREVPFYKTQYRFYLFSLVPVAILLAFVVIYFSAVKCYYRIKRSKYEIINE